MAPVLSLIDMVLNTNTNVINSTSYIYLERTHMEVPAWISTIQVRLVSEVESQLFSFTHAKKKVNSKNNRNNSNLQQQPMPDHLVPYQHMNTQTYYPTWLTRKGRQEIRGLTTIPCEHNRFLTKILSTNRTHKPNKETETYDIAQHSYYAPETMSATIPHLKEKRHTEY